MSWWNGPLVGFDLETTGVNVVEDRIVTASVIWDAPGQERRIKNFLLDPGIEIPEGAVDVHGVTTEQAQAEGIPAAEGVPQLVELLRGVNDKKIPFVAFNGSFDFTLLNSEAERYGLEGINPWGLVDPLVIDRQFDRYRRGKRTLVAMAELFGVALDNAHESEFDAIAAVELARIFGHRYQLDGIAELQTQQAQWHKAWAANFTAYLASKGKTEVIDGSWPLQDRTLIPA